MGTSRAGSNPVHDVQFCRDSERVAPIIEQDYEMNVGVYATCRIYSGALLEQLWFILFRGHVKIEKVQGFRKKVLLPPVTSTPPQAQVSNPRNGDEIPPMEIVRQQIAALGHDLMRSLKIKVK